MNSPSGPEQAKPGPEGEEPGPAAAPPETAPAIARKDLEAVIRRAVELSLSERDAEEQLSEEEVVRVATEVGLPARLARQALYELPALSAAPGMLEGSFGQAVVSSARAIQPANADRLRRRIEEYLSSHEYLQVVRRKGGRLYLVPAEDTISSLARGLLRPKSRYQLARARRVVVDVRSLDEKSSHVQIATDFSDQRGSAVRQALLGGSVLGSAAGGLAAALVAFQTDPGLMATAGQVIAFLGVGAGTLSGFVRLAARTFKRRMLEAKLELDGLLDRAEHGQRLEPPPAPWKRRLMQRFRGG